MARCTTTSSRKNTSSPTRFGWGRRRYWPRSMRSRRSCRFEPSRGFLFGARSLTLRPQKNGPVRCMTTARPWWPVWSRLWPTERASQLPRPMCKLRSRWSMPLNSVGPSTETSSNTDLSPSAATSTRCVDGWRRSRDASLTTRFVPNRWDSCGLSLTVPASRRAFPGRWYGGNCGRWRSRGCTRVRRRNLLSVQSQHRRCRRRRR